MRGFARPSRGASTVDAGQRLPRAQVGLDRDVADGVRDAQHGVERARRRRALDGARRGWPSVVCLRGASAVTVRPRSCERPRQRYWVNSSQRSATSRASGVVGAQRAVVGGLAHGDPLVAHVLEAAGARGLGVEVGDELAEDPRLVGIADPAVAALDDRLGDDPPPGEVPQAALAELSLVDGHRRLARRRGDLVRDRQDAVEAVLAWRRRGSSRPARLAAAALPVLTSTRQVQRFLPRSQTIAPSGITVLPAASLKRTSANVSITGDLGAPSSLSRAWPNSGTRASPRAATTSRGAPAPPAP